MQPCIPNQFILNTEFKSNQLNFIFENVATKLIFSSVAFERGKFIVSLNFWQEILPTKFHFFIADIITSSKVENHFICQIVVIYLVHIEDLRAAILIRLEDKFEKLLNDLLCDFRNLEFSGFICHPSTAMPFEKKEKKPNSFSTMNLKLPT